MSAIPMNNPSLISFIFVTTAYIYGKLHPELINVQKTNINKNVQIKPKPSVSIETKKIENKSPTTTEVTPIDTENTASIKTISEENNGIKTISLEERKERIKKHMESEQRKNEANEILGILEMADDKVKFNYKNIELTANTSDERLNNILNEQLRAAERNQNEKFLLSDYARIVPKKKK